MEQTKRQTRYFGKGEANPRWNGGKKMAQGYVFVQRPDHPNADRNGYVREHVLVMSTHLGRPIEPNEVVHHKNDLRDDNRIENLDLMTRAEHHSYHHKGVLKPGSIAALRGHTSEEMFRIWATTRAHEKAPPKACKGCGTKFFRNTSRAKYCNHACYVSHRKALMRNSRE